MVSENTLMQLLAFRRERDWEQFHTPRNLAAAVSVEAGELLQLFRWARDADPLPDATRLRHEVADVAILLLYLVNDLGIDLDAAVREKLTVNAARYPARESNGRAERPLDGSGATS